MTSCAISATLAAVRSCFLAAPSASPFFPLASSWSAARSSFARCLPFIFKGVTELRAASQAQNALSVLVVCAGIVVARFPSGQPGNDVVFFLGERSLERPKSLLDLFRSLDRQIPLRSDRDQALRRPERP